MKKALAWLLVIAMTAALAVGGTLAYLTDTDEDVNVMTVGKVKIDQLEFEREDPETNGDDAVVQEFHNNKPLYPSVIKDGFDWDTTNGEVDWEQIGKYGYSSGIWNPEDINNEQDKMVFVKNKGDFDAYVRTVFAFEAGNYETLDEYLAVVHFNLNDTDWTWEWSEPPVTIGGGKYFIATATYNKVLAPGALTEISLSQIALDPSVTNEDVAGFGDTFQVLVQSQAVQADGFIDADSALTEAFGELVYDKAEDGQPPFEIDPDDLPFEDDVPTEGVDLRTALHYLGGNVNDSKITASVQTVTFGLNKDYATTVDGLEGTLIDIEQDVDVYAYYKPNGTNYDVYILANDDIYTPVDSSSLFQEMTALTGVNTENLNTGRTESFADGFRMCSALQSIDCSDWDVSSLKTAERMFRQATALKSVDLSGWNAPNLTNVKQILAQDTALQTADVSGWNCPALVDASYLFYGDSVLTSIKGLTDWDMENVTTLAQSFRGCSVLTALDLSGWNMPKLIDASLLCYACRGLETVDISNWNTPSLEDLSYGFGSCTSLTDFIGSADLDTDSAKNVSYLFYGCGKLTAIDGSESWKMDTVTNTNSMFRLCEKLTDLDTSTWRLNNVTDSRSMFSDCASLVELDATNYGLSKTVDTGYMFARCYELVTLKSVNWTLSNVDIAHCMFYHCKKLQNVDAQNWGMGNTTDAQSMFNGCLALEYVDVSNWDVRKVVRFNSMFTGIDSNAMDMNLKEIDISKWQPLSAQYMNHMFYGCAQLTSIDMSGWNLPNLYTTSHMFADCINLETIDVSGWHNTSSWYSMDAMFNDCRKVKLLDVSTFDTSNVVEFSQIFEACWALEEIRGLENWNTANGKSFDETFLNCGSLKVLNLSSFDTRNAQYGNKHLNGDTSQGFDNTFNGVNSLEKLILGENFVFDGNGTVTAVATLPNPVKIDGQAAVWYNEANGTYYTADEIPEGAATYIAVVKPAENG